MNKLECTCKRPQGRPGAIFNYWTVHWGNCDLVKSYYENDLERLFNEDNDTFGYEVRTGEIAYYGRRYPQSYD